MTTDLTAISTEPTTTTTTEQEKQLALLTTMRDSLISINSKLFRIENSIRKTDDNVDRIRVMVDMHCISPTHSKHLEKHALADSHHWNLLAFTAAVLIIGGVLATILLKYCL